MSKKIKGPHSKESIKALLETNDRAVERGLVQLYRRQTATERTVGTTVDHNGVGFSGFDGEFLSSLAQSCLKYGRLTPGQMAHARKKILKYAGQLADIANAIHAEKEGAANAPS